MNTLRKKFASDDVEVIVSDLLVATADSHDALLDDSVGEVLRLMRASMKMGAV